jgi:hypothetical protein
VSGRTRGQIGEKAIRAGVVRRCGGACGDLGIRLFQEMHMACVFLKLVILRARMI